MVKTAIEIVASLIIAGIMVYVIEKKFGRIDDGNTNL